MIELPCVQGSPEWQDARRGVVTASAVDKIITPKTLKPSSQSGAYMAELLAGWALGYDEEGWLGSYWTERGHQYEGEARDALSLMYGVEIRPVGLVYRDESRLVACSPDGLIGDDGGVEIKCPMARTHVGYLLNGGLPDAYRLQVQFSLWVTQRDYWLFSSYHPELPPLSLKVEPDPEVQGAFNEHVPVFIDRLQASKQLLTELGVTHDEHTI
jgi:hypothetical protein